jgi:SAM-dependent methyltransferase
MAIVRMVGSRNGSGSPSATNVEKAASATKQEHVFEIKIGAADVPVVDAGKMGERLIIFPFLDGMGVQKSMGLMRLVYPARLCKNEAKNCSGSRLASLKRSSALKSHYESIAAQYVEARKDSVTLFLEMPSVKDALGSIDGKNVIDFACGTGHYTRFIKELGAKTVLGIDLSPAMIAIARSEERRNPRGIEYVVADACEEQIIGRFDVATAIFLFNYADDAYVLGKMLSNVAANLEDSGKVVAVVPNPEFINGLRDTAKYDFLLEVIQKRPSNLRVRMTFLAPEKFSIEFTQWSHDSYEIAMRRSGFEEVTWIPFAVAPEGIARRGEDYWAELLSNPKSILLCAKKRRSTAA